MRHPFGHLALATLAALSAAPLGSCFHADLHLTERWAHRSPASPPASYDQWQQKSVHNAYAQPERVEEQLGLHRFRSVEFDVHREKVGRRTLSGDWHVYHVDFPGFDESSCRTLSACLGEVAAFHRREPDHDVLTVFIDLKDEFAPPTHHPAHLDARLRASLPPESLLEPRSLLARCTGAPTLRASVTGGCSWPSLEELRGKIAVVLTGGDLCSPDGRLATYVRRGLDAGRRVAFIGPNVSDTCPFTAYDPAPYVVYFNLDYDSLHHAISIGRAGLISRAYYGGLTGGLNDPDVWRDAAAAGVQFLVTDRVDSARYPWTDTVGPASSAESRARQAARSGSGTPGVPRREPHVTQE